MKALIVAGGSGGHLIPALTLARRLRRWGACVILSTTRPVDQTLRDGSELKWIAVDLDRFTPLRRWLFPPYAFGQVRALRRVWKAVRRFRPDIVIGFGGYLSAVGVFTARLSGFPTLVHEQNFLPGQANRWLAPYADAVAVSFPETQKYLSPRARVEVTGNPIPHERGSISFEEARAHFGFDRERPLLLVVGGSQGSRFINAVTLKMWEGFLPSERGRFQVLHLAGPEASSVSEAYRRMGMSAKVYPFMREMDAAYTAATAAISRAGATTIAQMCAFQLPALLIPYPYAGGHQRANARWMESLGAAVVLEEKQLKADTLRREVGVLVDNPQRLARMREVLAVRSDGSAVDRLETLVRRLAE